MSRSEDDSCAREREEALFGLLGKPLSTVGFGVDWLDLHIDFGGRIRSTAFPRVLSQERMLIYGGDGYRDRLRSLLTHTVKSVSMPDASTIEIAFDEGTRVIFYLPAPLQGALSLTTSGRDPQVFMF